MRVFLLLRSALLVGLLASTAEARDEGSVRSLLLSEHPREETHRVFVRGAVVTTLRFERPVDPARTKMLGGEGRLEPLAVVRNKVLLEPLHDLHPDEAIPLVVTLEGGAEVAFLLRPASREGVGGTDQQVDVFEDRGSYAAIHAALMRALKSNETLIDENTRHQKEETSEDHALATLLVAGAIAQTPFTLAEHFSGKDADAEVSASVFQGKGKAAVVFKIKNLADDAWKVQRVRLATLNGDRERAVAVRSSVREIPSGGSGLVALVVDDEAFVEEGSLTTLLLEVYRHDGARQAFVQLDPSLVAR